MVKLSYETLFFLNDWFVEDDTLYVLLCSTAIVPWPDEEADVTFLGLMPTSKKKAFCELERRRGVRPRIEMFPKQFQVWPDLGHMLLFCESYKASSKWP